VWHFACPEPNDPVDVSNDFFEQVPEMQHAPTSPGGIAGLEARLAEVEDELVEKWRDYEDMTNQLNELKDEKDEVTDDIVDDELASCGLDAKSRRIENDSALPPIQGAKWQQLYLSLVHTMDRIRELNDELELSRTDIDELEDEAIDIGDALDRGYSEWEETEYRKAEAVIEQAPACPPPPEGQLLGEGALTCLSEDARKILETYLKLDGIYATAHDLQSLDCSPLVAAMAKVCERILGDVLGPKCSTICADPAVVSLLNDPKRNVTIPTEDQSFNVDKGSLRKVLGLIRKPGAVRWSGTRNGAIALLLFGRTYKVGEDAGCKISNPLKVHGNEEECQELRLDLYRLQQLRNGFIHQELAGWTQAQEVKRCFVACLQRLVSVLFGVSPGSV
jgi:hypothetical protein